MTRLPMKIPRSWRRMTAYHMVVASLPPWIRSQGRPTCPSTVAILASTSCLTVAT